MQEHKETIFIFLALILIAFNRAVNGAKSGGLYALEMGNKDYQIRHHFWENLYWYSNFGALFLLLLAYLGLQWKGVLEALILTMLSSSLSGYFRQDFINKATKTKEEPKAEWFFGIWYKRFWFGKTRLYISLFSLIFLLIWLFYKLWQN